MAPTDKKGLWDVEKPKTYQAAIGRINQLEANFAGMMRQKIAMEKRAEQAEAALAAVPRYDIEFIARCFHDDPDDESETVRKIEGWLATLPPTAVQP